MRRIEIRSLDTIRPRQRNEARFDIAIAGELNLDFILYGLQENLQVERETLVQDFILTLGSSSAITAHNMAVLGSKVGFASRAAKDFIGDICHQRLQSVGVNLDGVVRAEAGRGTGASFLLPLPNSSSRRILTYPGAMFEMGQEDIDESYLASARHFHLAAFFLHRKLMPHIPGIFAAMKKRGLSTSLDTNDDPEDEWGDLLHTTLQSVDILLCNQRELQKIAQLEDVRAAAKKIAQIVPLVIVKCGAEGARAIFQEQEWEVPAIPVSPVDTIGAGDSFNAGFLHEWLQGTSLEKCLSFGNITGAFSTTRQGGTEAFRDLQYLKHFLNQHWNR